MNICYWYKNKIYFCKTCKNQSIEILDLLAIILKACKDEVTIIQSETKIGYKHVTLDYNLRLGTK